MSRRPVVGIFFVVYAIYLACPIATTFDSKWLVPTVLSLLREGDLDLNEYTAAIAHGPHGTVQVHGHWYNEYPLGPSLVALPFIAGIDVFCRAVEPISSGFPVLARSIGEWRRHFNGTGDIDLEYWNTAQRLIASLVVALAVALFFVICVEFLSPLRALALTGIFALCTSCLSTASRALWQHGPSLLFLTLTLLALIRAQRRSRWLSLAGVSIAISYLMRPTNSIAVALISAYLLLTQVRNSSKYLLGAAVVVLPWIVLNLKLYGFVLPPYYLPTTFLFLPQTHFFEGLAGTLISPARGLLTFTPVLLFVPAGLWFKARSKELGWLDITLAVIIVLHWLVIASSISWWGGHCYGPRMFTDVLPFLAYFLIPVVARLRWRGLLTQRLWMCTFAALAVLSFLIHLPGATSWPAYRWNSEPTEVGLHPDRLWDFKDLQPLRGARLFRRR